MCAFLLRCWLFHLDCVSADALKDVLTIEYSEEGSRMRCAENRHTSTLWIFWMNVHVGCSVWMQ